MGAAKNPSSDGRKFLTIWPWPKSVQAGTMVAKVQPIELALHLGSDPESRSTTVACCKNALRAAWNRLGKITFNAGANTPPYTRVSFPPLINATMWPPLDTLLKEFVAANNESQIHQFRSLTVNVKSTEERAGPLKTGELHLADESYHLSLHLTGGVLTAASELGALHGLNTFSHLISWAGAENGYLIGPLPLEISDAPRFPWRGLMVDTARHFVPVRQLKTILDGMATMKLNVLHWHMTDAQSFPFRSQSFPLLGRKGAFRPQLTYTHNDVKELVSFARDRGIRVVPEFDLPAHCASWGKGYPSLVVRCDTTVTETEGSEDFLKLVDKIAIRPFGNFTWTLLRGVFQEVLELFPDPFVHLGGDEVDGECWQADPAVRKFKERHGYDWKHQLEERFRRKLQKMLRDLAPNRRLRFVLWESDAIREVDPSADTRGLWESLFSSASKHEFLVQTWRFWRSERPSQVRSLGWDTLKSEGWYLDFVGDGWDKFYKQNVHGTLGGEACSWSEHVDEANLEHRIFQRLPAVAERLWSAKEVRNIRKAKPRLSTYLCRLKRMGIRVGPIEPDYCELNLEGQATSDSAHSNFRMLQDVLHRTRGRGIIEP